ncbi:MAG: hypothetical protein AAF578_00425 [Pseudomonadota bacterium]
MRHQVTELGGFEAVGVEIFPAKSRKAAGNWLSDCLNDERPAKLSLDEVVQLLRIGRNNGSMVAFDQLGRETNTEIKPATPRSERAELLDKQARLIEMQRQVQSDIDRLDEGEILRAVSA